MSFVVRFALAGAGNERRFIVSVKSSKINLSFVKNISDRLAFAIRISGHSKGALATAIGVPQSSVSRWLNGSEPRSDRLAEIAKFLSVDVKWLMTGEGSPTPAAVRSAQSSTSPKETSDGHRPPLQGGDQLPDLGKMMEVLERIAGALEALVEHRTSNVERRTSKEDL